MQLNARLNIISHNCLSRHSFLDSVYAHSTVGDSFWWWIAVHNFFLLSVIFILFFIYSGFPGTGSITSSSVEPANFGDTYQHPQSISDDENEPMETEDDLLDSFKMVRRNGKKHFCKCKRGPVGPPGSPGIEGLRGNSDLIIISYELIGHLGHLIHKLMK